MAATIATELTAWMENYRKKKKEVADMEAEFKTLSSEMGLETSSLMPSLAASKVDGAIKRRKGKKAVRVDSSVLEVIKKHGKASKATILKALKDRFPEDKILQTLKKRCEPAKRAFFKLEGDEYHPITA